MSQNNEKKRAARLSAEKKKQQKARTHRDAAGRVHLSFHRDPETGNQVLELVKPVFKESWQNEIAAAAANTAYGLLRGEVTLERTVELAKNAMAATSRLTDGMLATAPEGALACKAGCDHCCYQVVGVTPPEAFAIVSHLKNTRTTEELTEFSAHTAALDAKGRGLSSSERFSPDHPCPFLDVAVGRCTIYEVRPLSCRGMNSLDAGECAKRLRDPQGREEFLSNGYGGHTFLEPIRAFHAISAGMQLGLAELLHLDMRPLELTAAMNLLLNGPGGLDEAWAQGERALAPARSADFRDDPAMRELSGAVQGAPTE